VTVHFKKMNGHFKNLMTGDFKKMMTDFSVEF